VRELRRHGREENCVQGKPVRKRPIRTPKISLEANIKIGLINIGFEGANYIYVANDRDK
jgi:hypothetical protein